MWMHFINTNPTINKVAVFEPAVSMNTNFELKSYKSLRVIFLFESLALLLRHLPLLEKHRLITAASLKTAIGAWLDWNDLRLLLLPMMSSLQTATRHTRCVHVLRDHNGVRKRKG